MADEFEFDPFHAEDPGFAKKDDDGGSTAAGDDTAAPSLADTDDDYQDIDDAYVNNLTLVTVKTCRMCFHSACVWLARTYCPCPSSVGPRTHPYWQLFLIGAMRRSSKNQARAQLVSDPICRLAN